MPGSDERRKEIRVSLPIKFNFNLLGSPDEFTRTQTSTGSGLETGFDTAPILEGKDELERFLLQLSKKLDFIISLLTAEIGRKHYDHKGTVVDISESGMRIISPVTLSNGDVLEIGLVMPHMPHRTMDIVGQVAWGQKGERIKAGEVIGIKFIDILVQDQDEIVHWLFQKQREEIRRLREEG
ncbi:MAG: PilZ domain-containing protein [Pseudomonadota bacterium]